MLQGSLENFALDEVLGLLSSTNKTGQLEITGDRGTGALMFSEGRLADANASYTANGSEIEDVMFELLRYVDGTFTFTNREIDPGETPQNVASVLAAAENRLQDWRSIEAVVPTLDHHVAPSADLPADEVTIDRAEWAALTVIAAGCPASLICDSLDLGEVEGSRRIKNLAERELVALSEPSGGFASVARASGSLPSRSGQAATASNGSNGTAANGIGSATNGNGSTESSVVGFGVDDAPSADSGPAEAAASKEDPVTAEAQGEGLISALSEDSLSDGLLSMGAMGPDGLTIKSLDDDSNSRPPMPPAPRADEVTGESGPSSIPPAPPSPAEISSFSNGVDDLSALVDDSEDPKGGLLARYRKGED